MPTLSNHDRAFADLYRGGLDDVRGNAKACYRLLHPRAKERTAEVNGSALLRKAEVRAYLDERADTLSQEADITQERVLRQIGHIAFADIRKMFDGQGNLKNVQDLDDATASAVQTVRALAAGGQGRGDEAEVLQVREVKLADKNRALEMLAKILQMWVERSETKHSGLEDLLQAIQGAETNTPMARLRARERRDGEDQPDQRPGERTE